MPNESVKLRSIKKLGHDNNSYQVTDEGNKPKEQNVVL